MYLNPQVDDNNSDDNDNDDNVVMTKTMVLGTIIIILITPWSLLGDTSELPLYF